MVYDLKTVRLDWCRIEESEAKLSSATNQKKKRNVMV